MTLEKTFSRAARKATTAAAFALALAGATAIVTPAHALEPKQCGSAAEMTEALKAEGQKSVILGNRMALKFDAQGNIIDSPRVTNVFTVNENGEGYNLEGNRPLGTPSTEFCVRAKYVSARFNNWERAGIPAFAQFSIPAKADVQRICTAANAKDGLACGDMASALTNGAAASNPERVMMIAQTINASGQQGKKLVVMGRPQDGGGSAYAADSRGIATELFFAEKMAFTPVGKAIINALENTEAAQPLSNPRPSSPPPAPTRNTNDERSISELKAYWADRNIECNGTTMTGAEWGASAQRLGTPEGRSKSISSLSKTGMSASEKERFVRVYKQVAERLSWMGPAGCP